MRTPYRIAAKNALMKTDWNGLSEKEAEEKVENSTFDDLESQIWAKGSMTQAVVSISDILRLSEDETMDFLNAVLGTDRPNVTEKGMKTLSKIASKMKKVEGVEKMTLSVLSSIHDAWVYDNAKKFSQQGREGKKYQHLPIEMIGWKEATADLLFLEPILNSVGVEVDTSKLKRMYDTCVNDYFNNKNLVNDNGKELNKNALTKLILKGHDFYSALTETNTAKSPEEAMMMTEQVCEKLSNIKISSYNK